MSDQDTFGGAAASTQGMHEAAALGADHSAHHGSEHAPAQVEPAQDPTANVEGQSVGQAQESQPAAAAELSDAIASVGATEGGSSDDDASAASGSAQGGSLEGDSAEGGTVEDGTAEEGSPAGTAAEGRVRGTATERGSSDRVRLLEREGEIAADFIESLLDIADLDGDLDVDIEGDRAAVSLVDSDEGRVPRRLVGTDGRVLDALQELTRLAVQKETGERSRLMLDIAGYRADRRASLVTLAEKAVSEVRETGEKTSLEPMNAFERKVVHDVVSAAGLTSESEGVEPNRHIVILPA